MKQALRCDYCSKNPNAFPSDLPWPSPDADILAFMHNHSGPFAWVLSAEIPTCKECGRPLP